MCLASYRKTMEHALGKSESEEQQKRKIIVNKKRSYFQQQLQKPTVVLALRSYLSAGLKLELELNGDFV